MDPIRGFTREPNGSEPHSSVLFIRTSLVRTAEPNWPDKLEPVCTVGLSVPVRDRSRTDSLSCAQGLNNPSLKGIELPIFFPNLKGYDMYNIIKEGQDRKVDMNGTSKEKLIAAKVHLLKEEDDGGVPIGNAFDTSILYFHF